MSVSISTDAAAFDLFANDPILSKMNDPNILWGDLFLDSELVSVPQKKPALTRKVIQKKYPVLVRLQSSKTLGIQWNMTKLGVWRNANPNPLDWKPYEVQTARTLIDNLRNSGWNVSAPSDVSFICTIERSNMYTQEWKYEEPDCPTMICLNDIKLFFPVIWHKLDSNDCKMYSIEMYHDKIRSNAVHRGINVDILTSHLTRLLHITLQQSPAWIVLDGNLPNEVCRLSM